LGLSDNIMPLCVVAVGKPAGKNEPRDKFESTKIHWNTWGKSS
jgi:hypothetical protein